VAVHRLAPVIALLLVAPSAHGGPLTQDACPGTAQVSVFKQLGNDVLENLVFAQGSMWVSDGTRSSVLRINQNGGEELGLTDIPSPGGLAYHTDGFIYAGWGNALAQAVGRTGAAKVVRFQPGDPNGSMATYAEGFNMPNGMTFGPDGALYISNDVDHGLIRIETDGTWSEFAHVWGTNGLVIDPAGETMYAAITFDQRSPIARIQMSDPEAVDHDIQLSFGAASLEPNVYADGDATKPLLGVKGLDDMTRDDAGTLYVVANGTGELLRVDPTTGDACVIASGLQNPSSVRIAPEGIGYTDADPGTMDFYITEFSGAIRTVRYAP